MTLAAADTVTQYRLASGEEITEVQAILSAAGLLNPLGFVREQQRDGARRRWVYRLDPDRLADLSARYGGAEDPS